LGGAGAATAEDDDENHDENHDDDGDDGLPLASFSDLFSFLGTKDNRTVFGAGCVGAVLTGLVYPIVAHVFSNSLSDLGGGEDGRSEFRTAAAHRFLSVGAYAFAAASLQSGCLEVASTRAAANFRTEWFSAILRQDAAFLDVHDAGGLGAALGTASAEVRRGLGHELGRAIRLGTAVVGGLVYSAYASWRVFLVVLAILPLVGVGSMAVMRINRRQAALAGRADVRAGSVSKSTVASIRTVLCLNAVPEMLRLYNAATLGAYRRLVATLWMQGSANGSVLGSFMIMYCILTLFGAFILYRQVEDTGCDPSAGVPGNATCLENGSSVFGSVLGAAFAGHAMSQAVGAIKAVSAARTACAMAMIPIKRTLGAPAEEIVVITAKGDAGDQNDGGGGGARSPTDLWLVGNSRGNGRIAEKEDEFEDEYDGNREFDLEHGIAAGGDRSRTAMLPEYLIDSSSSLGLKPHKITGAISFKNVSFAYPTRPDHLVLEGFNLDIKAGSTVALVGPSGGGKSTTMDLIERFYDPALGAVLLNGIDLKLINVTYLRSLLGYLGREPTLFALSIKDNIRYGKPNASLTKIVAAAKMANAHDFIQSLPDGYGSIVGDHGPHLSGSEKQRIAIARVLIANPKILLLDEASSALDSESDISESELLVQEALDALLAQQKRTTIIIARRLTTIRNADIIAVITDGRVVEKGTHEELMQSPIGKYRNFVAKQEPGSSQNSSDDGIYGRGLLNDAEQEKEKSRLSDVLKEQLELRNVEVPLKFRNVVFSYPTRPWKLILDGFDLSIEKGETLALVAPPGEGKSTTLSLIERFYDPIDGIIEYEGIDIREYNVKWLRDQIGMVQREPILFNMSIEKNIAIGWPEAKESDIVEAAKISKCHDFILALPKGYKTLVGERGAQLAGGQKQRIAIARALVKRPKILLLDDTTSSLDPGSERIVQEALDELMASHDRTTIVIAHRLSTMRNADRIAFLADGKVCEIGTHEELVVEAGGRYRRLVHSQKRFKSIRNDSKVEYFENGEDDAIIKELLELNGNNAFDAKQARKMAYPDINFLIYGAIGAIFFGSIFPAWGVLFAQMIGLLFRRVETCSFFGGNLSIPGDFDTCEAYWTFVSNDMRETSFTLGGYWVLVAVGCVFGNVVSFWGFGMASARMNKRIRDSAFESLVRQELAFFDKHSVESILSQLQDDAARVNIFTGEPIRALTVSLGSIIIGVTISLIYMWPFALVSLSTIPFVAFATAIEIKTTFGDDEEESDNKGNDGVGSPGGIAVETLFNIRTVSVLNIQKDRLREYASAFQKPESAEIFTGVKSGLTSGLSILIQQWSIALQLWWGGWLIFKYPDRFSFNDFLVSMFASLFSLFGLGAASMGLSEKKEFEKAAGRIFYLLERRSLIDPLGREGIKILERQIDRSPWRGMNQAQLNSVH
jgi:ATP-binding cassette subfamily B (MDR/TAP) protein 1